MLPLVVLVLAFAAAARGQTYAEDLPLDHPAIHYGSGSTGDVISRLQKQIDSGKTRLALSPDGFGYLPDVLQALGIDPDSQLLVFSKTSFQASQISPRNPRAIYFNDEVAVGFVRGGAGLEIAALDPLQGTVFYTLSPGKSSPPRFTAGETCLKCHRGPATSGVPGTFVGSVFPGPTGLPDRSQAVITDHRTPFADRWGGWYVNAVRGQQVDRANSVADDPYEPHSLTTEGNRNLPALTKFFNARGYLSPVSDIVALLTFEHQTQAINLLTRLGWELRMGEGSERIEAATDSLVKYLLFTGEAPFKEPIEGVSTFTKTFPRRGPRDHLGRSLRDFNLQTRLFQYPLSYVIYSPAFDSLPGQVRQAVYRGILSSLKGNDKEIILAILRDTKPDMI